jgi:hypothetical protein
VTGQAVTQAAGLSALSPPSTKRVFRRCSSNIQVRWGRRDRIQISNRDRPRRWWALALVRGAFCTVILDPVIVAVALPSTAP